MTDFLPNEIATPIRMPSTANLMIDSSDRSGATTSPWNFQITKNQALMNGFFTRIATTEVVLDWFEPNVVTGSNIFTIRNTGTTTKYSVTLTQGSYTVKDCLDSIVTRLNAATTGITFSIVGVGANCALHGTAAFSVTSTDNSGNPVALAFNLGMITDVSTTDAYLFSPDLRPYKYIDFISPQLTYNQTVKDASSDTYDKLVLCRWYFAWDTPPTLDAYGFPILMGYTEFSCRRVFNPPKQIAWKNSQPIGNLGFQVIGNGFNTPLSGTPSVSSGWQMTLQVSEV